MTFLWMTHYANGIIHKMHTTLIAVNIKMTNQRPVIQILQCIDTKLQPSVARKNSYNYKTKVTEDTLKI